MAFLTQIQFCLNFFAVHAGKRRQFLTDFHTNAGNSVFLAAGEILNQILQQAIQNQHTVTHKVVVGHRIKTALFLVLIHGRICIKEAIQTTVMRFQFPIRMRFSPGRTRRVFPVKGFFHNFFKTGRAYGARPVAYLGFNGVAA